MEEFRKVLIVDDEFIIRQGIEFLIDWKNEGYELAGKCNNGFDALKILEQEPIDIIISDIVMPEMDGIELTRQVHNKYPDTRVIILSSYSDFDYVKNTFQQGAVDYILKPTLSPETLLNALNKVSLPKKQLKQNTDIAHQISRYVSGYKDALDNIDLSNKFAGQYFYLLAANKRYDQKKDIESFLNHEFYYEFKSAFYCTFNYLEDFSIVLLNCDENKDLLYERVYAFLSNHFINDEFHYFAFTKPFSSIVKINDVCDFEIRLIFSKRFYCHDSLVMTIDKLPISDKNIKFDFRTFNNFIDSGQFVKSMELVTTYVNNAFSDHVSETEIKTTVGNAIYTIIASFEDNDLNEESIRHFKLNCFDLIESSITDTQFESRLKMIFDDFKILIDNYHLDSKDEPINKLLMYVKEHYNEPLSLQDLVDHFGFSYSYLSTYFANQSNGTFIEHLNRIRIEKACELLNDPKMSISKITEMVGYSDQSYFSKVFKKHTGITPREYRKR